MSSKERSTRYVVPGDKSITHRALFFGALSGRRTIIRNPSPAGDCRSTLGLLRRLGYHITEGPDFWEIDPSGRREHPARLTLDCGNSGTTARLAAGFLTGERGEFTLVGDESLSRRPMERVAAPLRRLGRNVSTSDGAFPVSVIADEGNDRTGERKEEERKNEEKGRDEERSREGWDERTNGAEENKRDEGGRGPNGDESEVIAVGSAQVHAALVLAAARSSEGVLLRRTKPMRDHTHRMCPLFGIRIERRGEEEFIRPFRSVQTGEPPVEIVVPGDFSSAAFLVAAALIVPDSDILIEQVGLNPTRIAFLEAVRVMGGNVEWNVDGKEREDREPTGTIRVRYTPVLEGVYLHDEAPASPSVSMMMDELPLLALLASQATGETVVRGAAELRVKESDRIAATAALLRSIGIIIEELEDGFVVFGPQIVKGGASVDHRGDHRLAMLAGVAGLIAREPVHVPEPEIAAVSWPGFWELKMFA